MSVLETRIAYQRFRDKVITAEQAANFIKDGMTVATSGFTPAGYPKAVPLALSEKAKTEPLQINLWTGASVGDELDGALTRVNAIKKRMPYQTNNDMRKAINAGEIQFVDTHLSHMGQMIRYGFFGKIDVAIVEVIAIKEDGSLILSTSVGNTPTFLKMAEKIILEVNTSQPLELEGIHDLYIPQDPPRRKPIPLMRPADRIGETSIKIEEDKLLGIVITDIKDDTRELAEPDESSKLIADNIIKFLRQEIKAQRVPPNLLPFQSGVGSVANATLRGLLGLEICDLELYSEVIQDSVLELIDEGCVKFVSGTSLSLSPTKRDEFYQDVRKYKDKMVLRPQEISNHPEIIRRLGVIAMNTAIEVDIYGNVNSTHVLGRRMMNGIGGSGDFCRNAYISIFSAPSIRKGGKISCVVPKVSHIDHTEHDVQVIITEQGIGDLRGKSPQEKAVEIITNCAHPDCQKGLWDYFETCKKEGLGHTPYLD